MTEHEYLVKSTVFRIYNPTQVYKIGHGICDCNGSLIIEGKHTLFIFFEGKFQWVNIDLLKLILKPLYVGTNITAGNPTTNPAYYWELIKDGYDVPIWVPSEIGGWSVIHPLENEHLSIQKAV